MKKTNKFFSLLSVLLITPILQTQGLTIAEDHFGTNSLNGGSGWVSAWNAGTVVDGVLRYGGGGSQTVSRNFALTEADFSPRPSSNAYETKAGSYTIQFSLGFDINNSIAGNYGFRVYQGPDNNGSTFGMIWKNNEYDGFLTFRSLSENVVLQDDAWNISLVENSYSQGVSYEFTFVVDVLHGMNPQQYKGGTYSVYVTRYEDGIATDTFSSEPLSWAKNENMNINNVLNNLTFSNTNNKTTMFIDDVVISQGVVNPVPVPEPGSAVMVMLAMTGFALIRRKRLLA